MVLWGYRHCGDSQSVSGKRDGLAARYFRLEVLTAIDHKYIFNVCIDVSFSKNFLCGQTFVGWLIDSRSPAAAIPSFKGRSCMFHGTLPPLVL